MGDRACLPRGNDHLDGVLDPVARVSERGGQIGERESMGMNLGGLEALFRPIGQSDYRHGYSKIEEDFRNDKSQRIRASLTPVSLILNW